MDLRATFAANVKRFRKERGLSQTELGDLVGVTYQSVLNYESAAKWPRDDMLEALARALKVAPADLLAPPEPTETITTDDALRVLAKHHGYRLVRL